MSSEALEHAKKKPYPFLGRDRNEECRNQPRKKKCWNHRTLLNPLTRIVLALVFLGGIAQRLWAAEVAVGRSLPVPIVFTQIPRSVPAPSSGVYVPAEPRFGEGGRLVLLAPGEKPQVISAGFHSACDPDVSFDGKRLAFAAKRSPEDSWNIYELVLDGSPPRQITNQIGNCRQPSYQSTLFTLDSPAPWYQITFVSDSAQKLNELGLGVNWDLFSCKLDGTEVRRLTYNLSGCVQPWMTPDGRIVFASWLRRGLEPTLGGRMLLFGINLDGTDYALCADPSGRRIKHSPCFTDRQLIVFVESDEPAVDGAGQLACVSWRRPLRSYRPLTRPEQGWYHTPGPLPGGGVLVGYRKAAGEDSFGIWLFDPETGRQELVFDDPNYHEIQPRAIAVRDVPDGRSSVVEEKYTTGKLYCLSIRTSDLPRGWFPPPGRLRLRVLEGVPFEANEPEVYLPLGSSEPIGATRFGKGPLVPRRFLGEVDLEEDGSFQVEVPANIPIELQVVDSEGMALRSCGWIWVKNHENRGCIGCHEDGELVPENDFPVALGKPAPQLTLPPERRRAVDFQNDVLTILRQKCLPCHRADGARPNLENLEIGSSSSQGGTGRSNDQLFSGAYLALMECTVLPSKEDVLGVYSGRYVHPGRARTSPLVWHIFGRNTSRPWDGEWTQRAATPIPASDVPALTELERRALVEWIDLGAHFQVKFPESTGQISGK